MTNESDEIYVVHVTGTLMYNPGRIQGVLWYHPAHHQNADGICEEYKCAREETRRED